MDSENYVNFDSEQQIFNYGIDQEEFDKMLKSFDDEGFKKQLQKLEEPAQSLQGTTEVKTYVPHKRKRQRPSKIIQAEGSIQKATQQKANIRNENNCVDLSELTMAAPPINIAINTKGLFNGKVEEAPPVDDNFKNDEYIQKVKCLIHQRFVHEIKAEDIYFSCDVEWIREDKLLNELFGVVYKYNIV
uniref:Uncharacterized protein n=1 Tax=Ceratitis capitata TaxID=7213 RepID=W8B370_CERCA